jgi:hypothetical protein
LVNGVACPVLLVELVQIVSKPRVVHVRSVKPVTFSYTNDEGGVVIIDCAIERKMMKARIIRVTDPSSATIDSDTTDDSESDDDDTGDDDRR